MVEDQMFNRYLFDEVIDKVFVDRPILHRRLSGNNYIADFG